MWDGNEVWLIAGGGTLYFAFPLLYASSFSGFYLPLMMVLWLLILRGIGIELRSMSSRPSGAASWTACSPLQHPAGGLFRRGAGQRDTRRAVAGRRLLFRAAMDRLAVGPDPGFSTGTP